MRNIKGAVIASGKETFSAGADLTMLEGLARLLPRMESAAAGGMQEILR